MKNTDIILLKIHIHAKFIILQKNKFTKLQKIKITLDAFKKGKIK